MQKLQDAKNELEKLYKIKVLIFQADVNAHADNEAVVKNVVDEAIKKFRRIDVLINNAQASASGAPLAWTSQLEQFEKAYPGAFKANVHVPPMGRF